MKKFSKGKIKMCGIGGIFNWKGGVDEAEAQKMLQALKHRGPDEISLKKFSGGVFLHARLAILDPAHGTQPVISNDGNLALVFNGEVYNFKEIRRELLSHGFRFRTDCDAEVVLAAYQLWGPDCLQRFNGMFAFAIYNKNKKELFLARDRMGIKPLVYYQTKDVFYFASEIQALLTQESIQTQIDPTAVDDYLHYQYVPAPRTIFKDLKKLSPAHYLKINAESDESELVRYWSCEFRPDFSKSEETWLRETGDSIDRVVKDHLISDVPFGAFLSGGIDSSTVVYHMTKHLGHPVKTFTIGFDEASCNESHHAETIAKKLGCEHRTEIITPESLNNIVDILAAAYGEPFADSSAVATYYVSKLAAESGVKMVLSGDGGDELFAGYNTYEKILSPEGWFGLPNLFSTAESRLLQRHSNAYAYFHDRKREKLYTADFLARLRQTAPNDFREPFFQKSRGWEPLSRLQHLDMHTYLPDDILTKVDVASMRHSLEVRVPLLDHRLVEFTARIPARLKLKRSGNSFSKKYLLTEYAASNISPELRRPKQGFGIPLASWLSEAFYPQLVERMNDRAGILGEFFDRNELRGYASTPENVRTYAPRLWALLMFQSWTDRFLKRSRDYAHAV